MSVLLLSSSIRRHLSSGSKASSSDSIRSGGCQSVSSKRSTTVRSCSHSSSCAELHRSMQRRRSGYRDQHGMCSVQRRQIRRSLETLHESSTTGRIQSKYVRQSTLGTTVHRSFVEVWYNIALCYYEMKQYAQAVQHLGAIVEKGIKDYPGKSIDLGDVSSLLSLVELSVGMQTEGIEITSVGNTITLQESTLVEAFNLRAAIEFILKNCSSLFARLCSIEEMRCSSRHGCTRSVDRHAAEKRE